MGTKHSVEEMRAGWSLLREFGVDLGEERKSGPASILILVIFLQPSRGLGGSATNGLALTKEAEANVKSNFP